MDRSICTGSKVTLGIFRRPVDHPSFRDSGPTSGCIVVFPRTGVWIRHEASQPFVADPNVVTIYNRAQRYERLPLSPDGDRCDWFGVADDVAVEIAAMFDPGVEATHRPFRHEWAPSTAALYLRQRALLRRAQRGELGALEADEEVVQLVTSVLMLAYQRPPSPLANHVRAARRHRDLAEAARAAIFAEPAVNRSVTDLATRLGASPFHLCRVFRGYTGRTMHAYRNELRVRLALELLESGRGSDLSAVAHTMGFASHAHFVRACRRHYGTTPSAVRRALSD